MPYVRAEKTGPVTVEKVELTLTADKRWVKAGEMVVLSGRLTTDGRPYPDQPVWIETTDLVGVRGPYYTDAEGYFRAEITYSHYEGCMDIAHKARWQDVYSPTVMVAVAFPTRISISAPSSVRPGETFTVTGVLEYEELPGMWTPLAGRTVTVYFNTTIFGQATTGSDGRYSVQGSIPSTGSYTLKAVFAGEGIPGVLFLAPSWAEWMPGPDWAKAVVDGLAATSPIIIVGGLVAYDILSKKGLKWP